jgi:hypothetical protein
VREGASAAAGEHDADRPAGEPAREPCEIGVEVGSCRQRVRLDGLERSRPAGEGGGAARYVVSDEVAASQAGRHRGAGGQRLARDREEPVRLLDAEGAPRRGRTPVRHQ